MIEVTNLESDNWADRGVARSGADASSALLSQEAGATLAGAEAGAGATAIPGRTIAAARELSLVDDAATAWLACRAATIATLRAMPLPLLCAALRHAAKQGVAISARTWDEAAPPERVAAARLYTHLLFRLSQPDGASDLYAVRQLLPHLPEVWARGIADRLQRLIRIVV